MRQNHLFIQITLTINNNKTVIYGTISHFVLISKDYLIWSFSQSDYICLQCACYFKMQGVISAED